MTGLERAVAKALGLTRVRQTEQIQSLWAGYGIAARVELTGGPVDIAVVKHVRPAAGRGRSHSRKLRSYAVEYAWYTDWGSRCPVGCRVPRPLVLEHGKGEWLFILEDLDTAGFDQRAHSLNTKRLNHCLRWLAAFHGTFLGERPRGLWKTGTYWHLATRPDEHRAMSNGALRAGAAAIDARLSAAKYQTIVHGDAKPANFCFAHNAVAAVDFQYVGGGCGMKDVAYFLSSCLDEDECESSETELLDTYFSRLRSALALRNWKGDVAALESEWRAMYPIAWTDFYRFLQGWSPGHWKIHRYSEKIAGEVLAAL